jgi:hypothetical protein
MLDAGAEFGLSGELQRLRGAAERVERLIWTPADA